MIKNIEKYIDFKILFFTINLLIFYNYIIKEEDKIILKYN